MWQYNYPPTIQHFGVKGMKWGVRKKEDTSGNHGSKKEDAVEKEKFKLSDKQKTYLKIGAAAVVAGLAIYGGVKVAKVVIDKKEFIDKLKDINPNFTTNTKSPLFKGTNMNCGNSVIAEELMMRGEKVHAKLNETGMRPEHLGQYFNGMHSGSITTLDLGPRGSAKPNSLLEFLNPARASWVRKNMENHVVANFPTGARGCVSVPHIHGNHLISFERVGNKVRFDNPQNPIRSMNGFFQGVITSGSESADHYGGMRFNRLDDLSINVDNIKEVVTTQRYDADTKAFNSDVIKGAGFVMNLYN